MSTRGGLTVDKNVVGDCEIDNEICAGDDITYEICVENTSAEDITVNIFDEINTFTMGAFVWSGVDVQSGVTTGSAGGGADVIDETLVLGPCAKFVYTIVVTTLVPFCGVVTNCVRYCTPEMKRPVYTSSEPVYVGITESEACLDHDSRNMNDALFELMPTDGRAGKLFDFIEAGYDLVDILEAVEKFISASETAKPLNPDYTGFAEEAEAKAALAKRTADAEARRAAAVEAATDTTARAAE